MREPFVRVDRINGRGVFIGGVAMVPGGFLNPSVTPEDCAQLAEAIDAEFSSRVHDVLEEAAEKVENNDHKSDCQCGVCRERSRSALVIRAIKEQFL